MGNTYTIVIEIPKDVSFPDRSVTFTRDGIRGEARDHKLTVTYEREEDGVRARQLIERWLDGWAFESKTHLEPVGEYVEKRLPSGEHEGTGQRSVRAATAARYDLDSKGIQIGESLGAKAVKSQPLHDALRHFNNALRHVGDTAIDREWRLFGIFKAVEALEKDMQGKDTKQRRQALDALTGLKRGYVNEVMHTANIVRHHPGTPDASKTPPLSDGDCLEHARCIIGAYAGRQ